MFCIDPYLYIREVCFENIRAGVTRIEEHQFGLLQMIRSQTFLNVFKVKATKAV